VLLIRKRSGKKKRKKKLQSFKDITEVPAAKEERADLGLVYFSRSKSHETGRLLSGKGNWELHWGWENMTVALGFARRDPNLGTEIWGEI